MIARDGIGAVTHRGVAAEAGLPPAAANYYFDGVDDLLVAALTESSRAYVAACDQLAADVAAGADLATALVDLLTRALADGDRLRAEYELYLLAARRPELRGVALAWADRLIEIAAPTGASATRVRCAIAIVEGLLLQATLGLAPPPAEEIERVVRDLLR